MEYRWVIIIFVVLLVLIVPTVIAPTTSYRKTKIIEGYDINKQASDNDKSNKNVFSRPFDALKRMPDQFKSLDKGFKQMGYALKSEFEAIGASLKFMGTDFANVMSGLNYMPPFLNSAFKAEAANINEMADASNKGIKDWFDAIPTAFDPYLIDSKDHDGVFDRTTRYINMYVNCGDKFSSNFMRCVFFYMIDILFETTKLIFVTYPIVIVKIMTNVDITCYYDKMYDGIVCIDDLWVGLFTFHLIHFPESIMNLCYYCDGIPHKGPNDNVADPPPKMPELKPPDFPQDIHNAEQALYTTFHTTIPQRMGAIGRFIGNSRTELVDAGIPLDTDTYDEYKANADKMTDRFGGAISAANKHFSEDIPNAFGKATDEFNEMAQNFHDAFN